MANIFSIGDYIRIKDVDINVDRYTRVLEIRRDILKPNKYSLKIADSIKKKTIEELVKSSLAAKIDIKKLSK